MNLGKQMVQLRKEYNLSQEDLAEKIFVSRQSISNWERGKSYPDIESLLLLSNIFNVSLDYLVTGDVDMMKREMKKKRWDRDTYLMIVFLLLTIISGVPAVKYFDMWGILIPVLLYGIAMFYTYKVEAFKRQHNLKTYSQIADYMDGKDVKQIRAKNIKRDRKDKIIGVAMPILSAIIAFFIPYIMMKIFYG